jgi:hypothetical protein
LGHEGSPSLYAYLFHPSKNSLIAQKQECENELASIGHKLLYKLSLRLPECSSSLQAIGQTLLWLSCPPPSAEAPSF